MMEAGAEAVDTTVSQGASAETSRQDAARNALRRRRAAALARIDGDSSGVLIERQWRKFTEAEVREEYLALEQRAGLAFSGGGIRSATIALGLTEALASRGRLYAFDMLSTVSGGGYFGSFLRALHVPRGSPQAERTVVTDRLALAEATMTSLPDQQYFRGIPGHSAFVAAGKTIKNPLWWLRENGRYLAPGGMTDYGFALAYIVRNWVSLLVFALSVGLVVFSLLQLVLLGLVQFAFAWDGGTVRWLTSSQVYTPLAPVFAGWLLATVGVAGAYWLSTPLLYARPSAEWRSDLTSQSNDDDLDLQSPAQREWRRAACAALFTTLLLGGILLADVRGWLPGDVTARCWTIGVEIVLTAALLSAGFTSLRKSVGSAVDFRREQTRLLATFVAILMALAAAAIIDWAALSLRLYLDTQAGGQGSGSILKTGALSGALASALSFLIAKLPGWFGNKKSGIGRFLVDHARQFALLAALLIIASIALLSDMLAVKLLWQGTAWRSASTLGWPLFGMVVGLVGFIALLFARSLNFVNLLALTPFYGSRLTRTFLGGSNVHRLDAAVHSEVTQGLNDDDIDLQAYMEADCAAPLHFINVTRNRTVGEPILNDRIDVAHDDPLVLESMDDPRGRLVSYESSLTVHDRHGDRMVFGPFGLRVGAEFYDWKEMSNPPSLGLLCAISGAAVGAGMGRLTSLGTAMALTLANVRLGYWWREQRQLHQPALEAKGSVLARYLPGLSCLARELLGRFSTRDHWFLSDGGHSENTGVLTLLERGCRFILASDNGQDEKFNFCDLEILIRTARTDIGVEVSVVKHDDFPKNLEPIRDCFLNGFEGDWRLHARSPSNSGFALLLKTADIPRRVNGVWKQRRGGNGLIVWLKPKPFADLPADIGTYAAVHPDFPQQNTANQFFDEAQWESYRRLGFQMGRRLFARREAFDPYLPVIFPKPAYGPDAAPPRGRGASPAES